MSNFGCGEKWLLATLVVTAMGALPGVMARQEPDADVISVESGRPLADVARTLQQRHGVVITYEDPPYLDPSQLKDITRPYDRVRNLVPRGGPFSFSYSLKTTRPEEFEAVLKRLLRLYRTTPYANGFRLEKADGVFHIVPDSRRNRTGGEEDYEAYLSTDVQLVRSGGPRSAYDALIDLSRSLEQATGLPMIVDPGPAGILANATVGDPPEHSSARSELLRILTSTGERLSWHLLYDPEESRPAFYLNLDRVPDWTGSMTK